MFFAVLSEAPLGDNGGTNKNTNDEQNISSSFSRPEDFLTPSSIQGRNCS